MNALNEIAGIMSVEEKKQFIQYLKQRNKRNDVHNIKLFKSLETDDINNKKYLYKHDGTNAGYHALRKRLYDSLIKFIGNRSFESGTSAEKEASRLILASRLLFEHKLHREAFKCIAKAERYAEAVESFSLLNEVYQIRIQYTHFNPAANLENSVERYNTNRQNMEQEERMNIAYALLRRELADIYHKGKVVDFVAFIKGTMEQQGVSTDALTFKSLYQILFIANEYASINSDYSLVEQFVEKSYSFIDTKEALGNRHLYYHIYVLYLLANIHFRNGRFTESEAYLQKMETQLLKENSRYHGRFIMRYTLLLSLTKNYSGNPGAAIDLAGKALKTYNNADLTDMNDLRLALLVFYLQQADRTAFKLLRDFNHADSWYEKKMGMDWAIKKKMVEVLLHAEFENTEIAITQLKAFKKRYKKYLLEVKEQRVLAYADAVEVYLIKPENIGSKQFKEDLQMLLPSGKVIADVFVLSFIAWLQAKAEKKPVYEVTLKLVAYFSPPHSA